jgi:type IV pilus assembly protein PilX
MTCIGRRCFNANPQRQRGLVLFIALIVMVAMTLAGIGMMRSLDTVTMAAGNVGFKDASLSAGDRAIEAGFKWLLSQSGTPNLNNTNSGMGYYSARPASEPDWVDPGTWAPALEVDDGAQDAGGYTVSYIIHRMCTQPNTAYNGDNAWVHNECALNYEGGASAGGSNRNAATTFQGNAQVYYRITARVVGPRDTQTFVQSFVTIMN